MNIISKLKEKITEYAEVYIKLIKLDFIGHTAKLLSYLMFAIVSLFIFLCIILFLGFGLTEVFVAAGLPKMGAFFITVAIYVLLLALVMVFRKNITTFFASGIIDVLTEGDDAPPAPKGE